VAGLVGVAAGIGALFAAGVLPAEPPVTIVQPETIERQVVRTEQPFRTATQVAEQVIPSIVEVRIGTLAEGIEEPIPTGSGSGVVYRADGFLITNAHVVQEFDQLHAVFADGRSFPAEVVGTDPHTDLAVLRISASGLTPISLGSSEEARVGDPAIAIGNPLGLEGGPSVTVGVISAFDRLLATQGGPPLYGMIQTDAPITRGSSGGALVDPIGRLLGITTAIGVSDVGAEGLGFAIPVEVVEEVVLDLIEDGEVEHAFLGLGGTTAFRETEQGAEVPSGAEIISLEPGSAIERAGARVGDVIVELEGEAVTTMQELVVDLRHYRAGDEVELTMQRGEEQLTLSVLLDRRPEGQ
jgi:serine protease Do